MIPVMNGVFKEFCQNLLPPKAKVETIAKRAKSIIQKINECFYGERITERYKFVGSYGRGTACANVSDIDMFIRLPKNVYEQYNDYRNNGQSAMLQAVKECIARTYPSTKLKGDGQVVIVSFCDNVIFEVVPVFRLIDGQYLHADSNNGGSWKITTPQPFIDAINLGDKLSSHKLKNLCRMIRAWNEANNVGLKGVLIDTLAFNFLKAREWGKAYNCNSMMYKEFAYYDLMSLDFFEYLANQPQVTRKLNTPGNAETVEDTGGYATKALVAMQKADQAIDFASCGDTFNASIIWKEIYGRDFPERTA